MMDHPTSCGTLIVNKLGQLLLCHVTNTTKWDIPKGMQDSGESTLTAAMRELHEEAGIMFDVNKFENLGSFNYRSNKNLHLYRVHAPDDFASLAHLVCTSYFPHQVTGKPTLEVDGFRWASRAEIQHLCWPKMAEQLLALDW